MGSPNNYVLLGLSKRSLERRGRSRRNLIFLQSILAICESPVPLLRRVSPTPGPHHAWLEANLPNFFHAIGQRRTEFHNLIIEHADKCFLFRDRWEKEGIPFVQGVAVYILSRTSPYNTQVTTDIDAWVVANYPNFKQHLPPADQPKTPTA